MNADENAEKPESGEPEEIEIVPAELVSEELVSQEPNKGDNTDDPILATLVKTGGAQTSPLDAPTFSFPQTGMSPVRPIPPPKPKPPYLRSTRVMQILLILVSLCSAYFFFQYCFSQSHRGLRGILIARRALWIAFSGLGTLFAAFRVQRQWIPKDVRAVVWIALINGLVCFLFIFSEVWSWAVLAWFVCHIPLAIVMNFAPHPSEDGASFDVNDSLAANGGAVASATLGVWALLGSLLTSMSIINGLLGICLGLWGLTSRKKALATAGILLCVLGIMSCMFNVTYLFWEMITVPDEDLMNAAMESTVVQ